MKLAMIEAKIILAGVVREFQLDLAPGQDPEPDPITQVTLSNRGGVNLVLTGRPASGSESRSESS